jgi:hypothetical protein
VNRLTIRGDGRFLAGYANVLKVSGAHGVTNAATGIGESLFAFLVPKSSICFAITGAVLFFTTGFLPSDTASIGAGFGAV